MSSLETYLTSLREIRSSGEAVDETSYYGALESFLNDVGKSLKPRVRCVIQLKNRGAGMPDGGLFTEDQFKKSKGEEKSLPQTPARGVIEIKPTSDDALITADGEQVSRYWGKYRQVLVTNYRDFVFVGQDASGKPVKLEGYQLAGTEKAFWAATAHPKKTAAEHGAMFIEFAKRALLHAAPLAAPEDVAWFLASYARDALARIGLHELPALGGVRKALEEALGLTFEGEKGEHFFRSTLVQTLFYGVFSAWVLWSKQNPPTSKSRFDWRLTAHHLRVPVLRKLFHEVADPGQLDDLNLSEILDWTSSVLNRIDRASFFSKFQEGHAVQYFYEPFLQAFDPELRKQLGVWYTPPEIVQYMVARVDTVLREELNLPDGLADKNVYVLDPCCGTGSYLVEVLNKIHETLKERGNDALIAADLKEAAKNRVFGFELLPAPFVVSHLQLGLLLQNFGAPLAEKGNERVGVYLTNALTGWEPPKGPKKHLLFAELEEERDAAEHVKRNTPILVILGNPPYNGFAGVSPEEEDGLLEPYKAGLKEWGITKNYLDDLYVRFFRVAERRIAEMTGRGIVCFISNFSYLGDPSFVVMRQRFLQEFDSMWFDCMNGDSRQTGKLTPEGSPDPSVFSTEYNREGIRVGTTVGLMIRKNRPQGSAPKPTVHFRHFWGGSKRVDLIKSLDDLHPHDSYEQAKPEHSNRFSFRPISTEKAYTSWPSIHELSSAEPMLGLNDNRGQALHDFSRKTISERMKRYFDPEVPFEELSQLHKGLTSNAASFNAKDTRKRLLSESEYRAENVWPFGLSRLTCGGHTLKSTRISGIASDPNSLPMLPVAIDSCSCAAMRQNFPMVPRSILVGIFPTSTHFIRTPISFLLRLMMRCHQSRIRTNPG
jgi:N-6 DNA Methylase